MGGKLCKAALSASMSHGKGSPRTSLRPTVHFLIFLVSLQPSRQGSTEQDLKLLSGQNGFAVAIQTGQCSLCEEHRGDFLLSAPLSWKQKRKRWKERVHSTLLVLHQRRLLGHGFKPIESRSQLVSTLGALDPIQHCVSLRVSF